MIVVLADVLKQLRTCFPSKQETRGPGCRVRTGIIDRDLVFHRVHVRAREAFDHVKLARVRQSPRHPKAFIEADGIDDKRLFVPVADGVSVIIGNPILGMRPSVHINHAECMGSANIHDVQPLQFGLIYKLDSVRREKLPRSAGRLAACMRLELILPAISEYLQRPGLKWNLHRSRWPWFPWRATRTRQPDTGFAWGRTEIHSTISVMRCGPRRRCRPLRRTARAWILVTQVRFVSECYYRLRGY